ncbi:helix-turn-helix domain-containing protein [Acaryochloris marina]|uniref:helix-turn-helix domain-containing protein n=1 Tax=Acaryochloris marina TaxID=155978 RepID=UPI00164F3536
MRTIMSDRELTIKDVSEATGYHVNTIGKWRRSKGMPKLDGTELDKLCEALDCSIYALLGKSSIDEPFKP